MSRETVLREYLNSVRDRYDVILLDCCPSLGMLTINALAAADEVIIPAQAHYLSLRGMEQLIRTISNVKRKINPALEIAGILITMADMRTNYSREIIDLLRNTYGSKLRIFDSIIPLSIRAAETSAEGQSIYLHDPAGKVYALLKRVSRRSPWSKQTKQTTKCWQVGNSVFCYALTSKSRKLNLRNVKPASMFRRVMDFQAFGKSSCVVRRECGIKRSNAVSVEVIHHQNDLFGHWILLAICLAQFCCVLRS